MKNIYYFNTICKIGGIETFFYELAKKYQDWDLTIYYKSGDINQINRLKQYVRVKKYNGEKIKCDKAFFNFNLDIIDNVEAKEYVLVVHGNYNMLEGKIPQHKKITKVIAVSKDSAKAYTELTGIPCEVCYNPLNIDKPKKTLILATACRLGDGVKGGNRTKALINELDKYCEDNNCNYLFLIFTNSDTKAIKNKNVCYMEPRLDILPYMGIADYVVQLSDNVEGFNYTINEALTIGTPVVITPCNVYEELGIDKNMSIKLDFDLSNIQEVVKDMFKRAGKFKFEYKSPKDNWDKFLKKGKSTYKEEMRKRYLVEALGTYEELGMKDGVLNEIPPKGKKFEVDKNRLDILLGENECKKQFVKVIKEIENN